MKRFFVAGLCMAALAASAARDPDYKDPNPYADYNVAMASVSNRQMAVEWQNANNARIAAIDDAWCGKVFAGGSAALKAKLDAVKKAYESDPVALAEIAALTQYSMRAKGSERELWTKALLDKAASSKEPYVQMFCLDQLRWCGLASQAKAVAAVGEKSGDKGVKALADVVRREIGE